MLFTKRLLTQKDMAIYLVCKGNLVFQDKLEWFTKNILSLPILCDPWEYEIRESIESRLIYGDKELFIRHTRGDSRCFI